MALEVDGADEAPAIGDADRTLQIVSNLVENALRLTPAGGSVRIYALPGELRVEDTGPGLQAEELERAFERFYLYSRYGRERPVGTGLGLAIVKELARAWAARSRRELSGPADGLHRPASARTRDTGRRATSRASERFTRGFTFGERRLTGGGKDALVSSNYERDSNEEHENDRRSACRTRAARRDRRGARAGLRVDQGDERQRHAHGHARARSDRRARR